MRPLDVSPAGARADRPYPPRSPWIMAQVWHDLLFAHWPIQADELRPLVPPALPLDRFDGQAWVGIVPFHMSGVRPRGLPALPGMSAFPELNVRTYVTVDGKPGVYFFSLDAGNRIAVAAARRWFRLPYFHARISVGTSGDTIHYASRRIHRGARPAHLRWRYRPTGPVRVAEPGTLAEFLTDRYCLYTVDARGRVYRCDIDHGSWPLQPAEAELESSTMAETHGIRLPDTPPLLHFAKRLEMVAWLLAPIEAPCRSVASPWRA